MRRIEIQHSEVGFVHKTIQYMDKFLEKLSKCCCIVLLTSIITITLIQVFCRFFLGFAFAWGEEIVRYMGIWIAFLGIGLTYKMGDLMSVHYFLSRCSSKKRKLILKLTIIINIIFVMAVVCSGYALVRSQLIFVQPSPAMQIPMYIPYMAIPVGMFIFLIFLINSALSTYRIKDNRQ